MKTYNSFMIIFLLSATSFLYSQAAMEDVVYLKNGSIVRGIIIEQIPNETIKIKTADGNLFVFKMQEITKIAKEESHKRKNIYKVRTKSPSLAFAYSAIIPGTGQFYNGDVAKGILHIGVTPPAIVAGILLNSRTEGEIKTILMILGVGTYLWSVIDAPISANRINKKRQSLYGHPLELKINDQILGMDFGYTEDIFTTKIFYHF